MTNDTTTLNGALMELGETLATNLNNKGVSANASDGLTTLANKVNQIYTGECYFIDTLNLTDYLLRDTTISSISIDNDAIKIATTSTSNQSIFYTLNRGPIIGDWKVTYDVKTSSSVGVYHRVAGSRTGSVANINNPIDSQNAFVSVEWTLRGSNMEVKYDNESIGTTSVTPNMYYPIFAFYFNPNEYALIKNLKIIKI